MTGWNLPNGCSDSDLPGQTPEDAAWEVFMDTPEFAACTSEAEEVAAFRAWRDRQNDAAAEADYLKWEDR